MYQHNDLMIVLKQGYSDRAFEITITDLTNLKQKVIRIPFEDVTEEYWKGSLCFYKSSHKQQFVFYTGDCAYLVDVKTGEEVGENECEFEAECNIVRNIRGLFPEEIMKTNDHIMFYLKSGTFLEENLLLQGLYFDNQNGGKVSFSIIDLRDISKAIPLKSKIERDDDFQQVFLLDKYDPSLVMLVGIRGIYILDWKRDEWALNFYETEIDRGVRCFGNDGLILFEIGTNIISICHLKRSQNQTNVDINVHSKIELDQVTRISNINIVKSRKDNLQMLVSHYNDGDSEKIWELEIPKQGDKIWKRLGEGCSCSEIHQIPYSNNFVFHEKDTICVYQKGAIFKDFYTLETNLTNIPDRDENMICGILFMKSNRMKMEDKSRIRSVLNITEECKNSIINNNNQESKNNNNNNNIYYPQDLRLLFFKFIFGNNNDSVILLPRFFFSGTNYEKLRRKEELENGFIKLPFLLSSNLTPKQFTKFIFTFLFTGDVSFLKSNEKMVYEEEEQIVNKIYDLFSILNFTKLLEFEIYLSQHLYLLKTENLLSLFFKFTKMVENEETIEIQKLLLDLFSKNNANINNNNELSDDSDDPKKMFKKGFTFSIFIELKKRENEIRSRKNLSLFLERMGYFWKLQSMDFGKLQDFSFNQYPLQHSEFSEFRDQGIKELYLFEFDQVIRIWMKKIFSFYSVNQQLPDSIGITDKNGLRTYYIPKMMTILFSNFFERMFKFRGDDAPVFLENSQKIVEISFDNILSFEKNMGYYFPEFISSNYNNTNSNNINNINQKMKDEEEEEEEEDVNKIKEYDNKNKNSGEEFECFMENLVHFSMFVEPYLFPAFIELSFLIAEKKFMDSKMLILLEKGWRFEKLFFLIKEKIVMNICSSGGRKGGDESTTKVSMGEIYSLIEHSKKTRELVMKVAMLEEKETENSNNRKRKKDKIDEDKEENDAPERKRRKLE